MTKSVIIFISILLLNSNVIVAQETTVYGLVKDYFSNKPLPLVNLVIANTTIGTVTNEKGEFEIKIEDREFIQLQVSFLGYQNIITEEVALNSNSKNYVEILLKPTSESLDEITVKPSVFINRNDVPISIQRIGIKQFEKSAGANRDISRVIQSMPGVSSPVSYRNDLIVRGGGPSENIFVLDGIEVPTINHFSTQGASGGPVGMLNVDFIREVEFYSSAFPVNYGDGISSVLDFKQIDGGRDNGSAKLVLGASEVAVSGMTPISSKTTVSASVRRSYLQLLFKVLDLPFLPTFTDFQVKTKTKLNAKNELVFLGVGAVDKFELNSQASNTPENQYIRSYVPVNEQWNYTVGSTFKHYFDGSYITMVVSRSKLNNEAIKYRDNIESVENLISDYKSYEIDNKFRLEYNFRKNDVSFIGGGSIEFAEYYNSTFRYDYQKEINNIGIVLYNSDLNFFRYSGFGSVSFPFYNGLLVVNSGVRVSGSSYSNEMKNPLSHISPRLSAALSITKDISFNLNIARYYKLPEYTTLGYRNLDDELVNKINKLKFIRSDHFVAGFDYRPNRNTKISLEGFVKKYTNYPVSLKDSVSLASKGADFGIVGDEEVISVGKGSATGLELLIQKRMDEGMNFSLAYTYVRSRFSDLSGRYYPSSWDNRNLVTVLFNKSLKRRWDIGLKWRFVGGTPYTPVDLEKTALKVAWDSRGREYLDYSKYNQKRIGDFHQLDLRVDKTLEFSKWSLNLYFDIQNLYNSKIKDPVKYVLSLDAKGDGIVENPNDPIEKQKYVLNKIFTENGTILPTLGLIIKM